MTVILAPRHLLRVVFAAGLGWLYVGLQAGGAYADLEQKMFHYLFAFWFPSGLRRRGLPIGHGCRDTVVHLSWRLQGFPARLGASNRSGEPTWK